MLDHNPLAASVRGERYEASVPDTLDLADRMGLAVNALTNVWSPSERFALAFNVDFSRRLPLLSINHLTDAYLNIPAKLTSALDLVYGAIDMIVTPEGEHVFLEINPSGQFGFVEQITGLPILSCLADALVAGSTC